jgi:site-specific DNA-methyltransferase (adenine-specific)
MLLISPDQIVIEDRQRTVFAEQPLQDLEESIDALGLIHPPALRYRNGQFVLAAGERRLRACKALIALGKQIRHGEIVAEPGLVPCLNLGSIEDSVAFEVELDENIKRENLSWQERAVAEARLLEIRGVQNASAGLPKPTLTAIASEIVQRTTGSTAPAEGAQITAVANRIRLAEHLHDPEVAKAKTEQEAIKVVRKKAEAARVQTLAAAFDSAAAGDCPHTLLQGDFRTQISEVPTSSVDVLLTDPPYGIDADGFGEQAGTGHAYEDSQEYFEELIAVLAEESFRVCKDQAHAYVFCDPRRFGDLQTHFELAGWKVWPIPLIWAKGNGMLPRPEHAPRRTYECIMFASKGDKPVRCVKGDVISVSAVRDLKHGAQKPVDLYVDLLSRSVVPGDSILDTFAGSGTIFPAANRCKVKATGIELSDEYAAIAKLRMTGDEDTIPGLEELEV